MPPDPDKSFPVVAVGASAGGFEAFNELIAELQPDLHAALVLIQHLPPGHSSLMPELLQKKRPDLRIQEITEGMVIKPGVIYLAPSGARITIVHKAFRFEPSTEQHPHHTIDTLFHAVASEYVDRGVGVILSGAGNDGARGAMEIRTRGGSVLVQNPATAHFPSMPHAAISADSADLVLNPDAIAREIATIADAREASVKIDELTSPKHLSAFFELLYKKTGFRFHQYKRSVIERRVRRRMQLRGFGSVEAYIQYLSENQDEVVRLTEDLMIGVTSFFRDPGAWEQLRAKVIRPLIREPASAPLRIWTPACSTGEESYSIAIMLCDELSRMQSARDFQVFATDINDKALGIARRGEYSAYLENDLPAGYRHAYFTSNADGSITTINKEVRDHLIFARHDLLADPPFSKLDLIMCRNLLIYLEPPAQQRCIDIFHYALREHRYLFLGKAEDAGGNKNLFKKIEPADSQIYVRLPGNSPARIPASYRPAEAPADNQDSYSASANQNIIEAARAALVQSYAPAAVAIDRQYTIVFNNGPISSYLTIPPGRPTHNLLEMLPSRLGARIRGAVYRLGNQEQRVTLRTTMKKNGRPRSISLEISRIQGQGNCFLIVFEDRKKSKTEINEAAAQAEKPEDQTAVAALETELAATRLDLRQHIEQLQSVNEELQSSNEELQAANEELETSREELQSLNEELVTVNAQLQGKIAEQEETNNDLINFQNSANISALFLGRGFRIRRFTPAMTGIVKLIPSDVGRPLSDLSHGNLGPGLLEESRRVLDSLQPIRREIPAGDRSYIRQVQPYRTADDHIDGVVVTFVDISDLKDAQQRLRAAAEKFRIVADFTYDWEYWRSPENEFIYMAPSCERVTGYRREEFMENPRLYTTILHPQDRERMIKHLAEDMHHTEPCELEFRIVRRDGAVRWLSHACRAVTDENGRLRGRRSSNRDITDRKETELLLWENEKLFHAAIDNYPSPFVIYDADRCIHYINRTGLAISGLRGVQAVGRKDEDIIPPEVHRLYLPRLKQAFKEKTSHHFEYTFALHGNQYTYVVDYIPLLNENRTVHRMLGVTTDITERKRTENALHEREERLHIATEAASLGVFEWDAAADISRWENDRMFEIFGRSRKQEPYTRETFLREAIHPEDAPAFQAALAEGMRPGGRFHGKCRIRRTDTGLWQWVEFFGKFELDENNQPLRLVGVMNDITNRVEAEEALRNERKLLDTIFESIPVMISIYEPSLDMVRLNKAIYDITGWSQEDVREKGIMQLAYPDPAYRTEVAAYMASLQPGFKDIRMTCKDGSVRETSWANICIPDGRRIGIGIDITGRKRAEQERERLLAEAEEGKRILEALLEHVPEGIIITEGKGETITVSRMLKEWTGRRMHNGLSFGGSDFVDAWGLMHPETGSPIEPSQLPITRVLAEGTPVVNDVWLQKSPDGSARYLSANAGPILNKYGAIAGSVVAWRDVTEQRKIQEELKRSAEELKAANQELEAFSYSVSHDLRAPLRAMIGFSEILEEDYADTLDDEGKEHVQRIKNAADKMNDLINDILSLSRVSRQEIIMQEVDLSSIVTAFVKELQSTNPDRRVEIRIQKGLTVRGDSRLLDIALSNLIRNAWKYTGKIENPRIEFSSYEHNNERVYFVRDNGAGFSMKHAHRLFQPFQRLHADADFRGTGIGLAIVERIIRRHGGRIWAEGEIGKGAAFHFTLNAETADSPA